MLVIGIAILVVSAAALAVAALAFAQSRASARRLEDALARTLQAGASATDVNALRTTVDNRLDNFAQVFSTTSQTISNQLRAAGDTITSVQQGLGEVRESSLQVKALAEDIRHLEELLRPPKTRGGVGEILLENVLSQVLHPSQFVRQFPLAGAVVDFAVKIGPKYVPVDAKFPLESYERLIAAPEEARAPLRREFATAVQKKIDDIAAKYIRPDLGTYDFALMYLPTEGLYYEAAVAAGGLFDYGVRKRVFAVSPATTYVYLATVALGLRGMALEGRVGRVIADLTRLQDEFGKVQKLFDTSGKHLRDASNKFDDAAQQLVAVADLLARASRLGGDEPPAAEPINEETRLF